jgi:uncharacterized membrane protein
MIITGDVMVSPNVNTIDAKTLLLIVLGSLSIFCFTVYLDIPFVRQAFGFLYLSIVPGLVFLKLLNINKLGKTETMLFSVGLSVAFLMVAGFILNEVLPIFGFLQPLSLMPLMIVLNIPVLIGIVFIYLKRRDIQIWSSDTISKSPSVLLFSLLPVLSIIGALYVKTYNNNALLLFLIVAIALLFVGGVFSKRFLPSNVYPVAVVMIALALLFHVSLVSNYLITFASDVPYEYFAFTSTLNNARWTSNLPSLGNIGLSRYNDMLSITVLPTVYANTLNLDAQLVFKILYPIIFSLVPLCLYQIWQKYMSKKFAFISAFLFVSQMTFYTEMFGLNRQMIAELFFVLLLLVVMHKKIQPIPKMLCFVVFSFALVTSHYALATVFLFFISFAFILLLALKRPTVNITATLVVLFFVIMFAWYIYTSGGATFLSIIEKIEFVSMKLGGFFNPASRGQTVLIGLGLTESPSLLNSISRMFAYLTQGLIVLGFIGLVTKRFVSRINKEFFIFSVLAVILLGSLVVVPGLADTLNMTRFYHILLFFLAPLCVFGAGFFVNLVSKRQKKHLMYILLLLVMVPYFLFQTNFVYEVADGDSWSIPLSGYRMNCVRLYSHYGYTDTSSVYGAQWVSKHVDFSNAANLYSDERTSVNVLMIYGQVYAGYVNSLSNTTTLDENSFIYLQTLNVVDGIIPFGSFEFNSSELAFSFDDLNLIYTNGHSEVYYKP